MQSAQNSKFLQTSGLTIIDARDMNHAQITKIQFQYFKEVPVCSQKVKKIVQKYTAMDMLIDYK